MVGFDSLAKLLTPTEKGGGSSEEVNANRDALLQSTISHNTAKTAKTKIESLRDTIEATSFSLLSVETQQGIMKKYESMLKEFLV